MFYRRRVVPGLVEELDRLIEHGKSENNGNSLGRDLDHELIVQLKKEKEELEDRIERLVKEKAKEKDPSLQQAENQGLKKQIVDLKGQLTECQKSNWKSIAADELEEENKKLKVENEKLRRWHENTPLEDKCKKGWALYFELKEKVEGKKSEFDQEKS